MNLLEQKRNEMTQDKNKIRATVVGKIKTKVSTCDIIDLTIEAMEANAIQSHSGGEAVGIVQNGYVMNREGFLANLQILPDGTELFTYQPDQSARIAEQKAQIEKYVLIVDRLEHEHAELQATNANPVCTVQGSWLWLKMIDYCKLKGIDPAQQTDLFNIVTQAHDQFTYPTNLEAKIKELESEMTNFWSKKLDQANAEHLAKLTDSETKLDEAEIKIAELEAHLYTYENEKQLTELQATNDKVIEASQAVVDRWDSPQWKEQEHTGVFIEKLRLAIRK